MVQYKLHSRR